MSDCEARRRKCTFSNCFVRICRQHNCGRGACPPRNSDQNKCGDPITAPMRCFSPPGAEARRRKCL